MSTIARPACPTTAGRTCHRASCSGDAPATREAATYCDAMIFCASARTTRATAGQCVSASATTMAASEPRNNATTTTVASRCGTAATASVHRISAASTRPPHAAAPAPTATPSTPASTAAPAATASDTRSAWATRTDRSCPSPSVPIGCAHVGGRSADR